ncbi:hypothetical protein KY084_06840 [Stakelama sp. CBK3Z-3]|uniref:Terminase n=1 Tax=Stakelama flava TaxID=2860338 RepID=A0ABS6XKA3_9SPHN|nr:hypothetical protein [Stakelama flava]MBW4330591.1 hypothetical protein [Stakelama flava]
MGAKRGERGAKAATGRGAAKPGAQRGPSLAVRKACFLEVLRQTGNVSRAAREAGLSSSTVYSHRAKQPKFARDWDAAMNEALDDLEAEMIDRATRGVEKPVYYRGEIVGNVRSYSDALGMFLLKARRPQVYDRLGGGTSAPGVRGMTQDEAKAEVMRRLDRIAAAQEAEQHDAGSEGE